MPRRTVLDAETPAGATLRPSAMMLGAAWKSGSGVMAATASRTSSTRPIGPATNQANEPRADQRPTKSPSVVVGATTREAPVARSSPSFVRSLLTVRKTLRRVSGPLLSLTLAAAVAWLEARRLGTAQVLVGTGHPAEVDLPTAVACAVALALLATRLGVRVLRRKLQAEEDRRTGGGKLSDMVQAPALGFELAILSVTGALALTTHLPQGLDGAGFALVYATIAAVATFARVGVTVVSAFAVLGLEVGMRNLAGQSDILRVTVPHALGVFAFAALNGLVLRGRVESLAARARGRVDREVERMRDQARSFRLDAPRVTTNADASGPHSSRGIEPGTGSTAGGSITLTTHASHIDPHTPLPANTPQDAERAARSGVEEIQVAVRFALDLLKRSVGAHTTILLFESPGHGGEDRGVLRLCDVVTDAKAIAEGPFDKSDGVLGAAYRRRAVVSLHGLKPSYRVPYYPEPLSEGGVTSITAVPILDGGHVRGVLCVDRLPTLQDGIRVDRPFSAHEEELVASAARYVLRAIENERVFGRLERAKAEQDRLYSAAQRLSGALTEAQVIEAGVESARAIASFDLAAITVVHETEGSRVHEVRAIAGAADFEGLVGLRFGDNGGLVAQAVKSRCTLPHRGDHDPHTQVVFTKRHPLRVELGDDEEDLSSRTAEVRSVLIVPLCYRDRALGTLVLGARRKGAFRELSTGAYGARTTLEVLASHVATSLANARMMAKLEELATTDGLTGLLNKRVLLELGVQKVRAAARYGRALSVIQTDIDFFKKVNDTYGHDVGDQVIKGLAGILRRLKRGTDYVARFGGEEFVIVCEETDQDGALLLAERVREELLRTTFHASSGPFQVTCSLGVATFPRDGQDWDTLYKATDDALYASKRTGRNRTTLATDLPPKSKTA